MTVQNLPATEAGQATPPAGVDTVAAGRGLRGRGTRPAANITDQGGRDAGEPMEGARAAVAREADAAGTGTQPGGRQTPDDLEAVPAVRGAAQEAGGGAGRAWTIELPAGLKLLSQNDRLHHMEEYRRKQALKKAAWAKALQAKLPHLARAAIVVEYQPAANRDRDPDNVPPASGKPCIDGLVAARVLPDDSKRYVESVKGVIGPRYPRGRIVLHITETEPLENIA